jgi:hypothetical protein
MSTAPRRQGIGNHFFNCLLPPFYEPRIFRTSLCAFFVTSPCVTKQSIATQQLGLPIEFDIDTVPRECMLLKV